MTEAADLRAVLELTKLGPILPLYGVKSDGTCRCEDPRCPPKNAGKHPHRIWAPGGLDDAGTDPEWIATWYNPERNVGVVWGHGFSAIDADDDEVVAWVEEQDPEHVAWFYTGRGKQWVIAEDSGKTVGEVEHVGIKGARSYSVVPPSIHMTQRQYRWGVPFTSEIHGATSVSEFRERLTVRNARLRRASVPERHEEVDNGDWEALVDEANAALTRPIPAGGRDIALRDYAYELVQRGLLPAEQETLMRAFWKRLAQPPGDEMPWEIAEKKLERAQEKFKVGAPVILGAAPELRTTSRLRHGPDVVRNTEIPWLIQGCIHQEGLGQLVAPEDTGKTIITLGLALSVANGLVEWAGYKIERPGPVVYVAMEGGPAFQVHVDAWLKAHPGCTLDNFYTLDQEELDLTNRDSVRMLEEDIDLLGIKPVLIVFDTQIDVTGSTDEMKPEIGHLLAKLRQWLTGRNTFGMLLHHPPYGEKRGRGSQSVRGKCDVLWYADKETLTVTWQKVKGSSKPAAFKFMITRVIGSRGAIAEFPGAPGLSELADTPAAAEGAGDVEKDRNTRAAILEVLKGLSPSMLREKNPALGWSNAEIARSLDAYASRPVEDGGPLAVHTHKTYYGKALDHLQQAGLIVDLHGVHESGKARGWSLADDE